MRNIHERFLFQKIKDHHRSETLPNLEGHLLTHGNLSNTLEQYFAQHFFGGMTKFYNLIMENGLKIEHIQRMKKAWVMISSKTEG